MKVINAMFAKGLGGIEQAFLDYTRALVLAKHEVVCVIQPKAKIESDLLQLQKDFPATITIKRIPNLGWWDISTMLCLECVVRKTTADIVIAHGNRPTSLFKLGCRKNGVKLVSVAHNYKVKPLLKADYILSITNDLKDFIVSKGFDESKIHIIPNMITISKEDRKNKFQGFAEPPTIGVIARFVKKKGVDVFLMACSALKSQGLDFNVIIAGGGEEASNLQASRDEYSLTDRVRFIGWVKDKNEFYNNIDIFCLPSHHEPFGIVLLEAMVKSKPIVSTESEGPLEILEDRKDGLLVEVGHAGKMAIALKEVLEDKKLARKIANAGHKKVLEKYAIEEVSKLLSKTLNGIK